MFQHLGQLVLPELEELHCFAFWLLGMATGGVEELGPAFEVRLFDKRVSCTTACWTAGTHWLSVICCCGFCCARHERCSPLLSLPLQLLQERLASEHSILQACSSGAIQLTPEALARVMKSRRVSLTTCRKLQIQYNCVQTGLNVLRAGPLSANQAHCLHMNAQAG